MKIGELALLAVSQPINITAKVVSVEDVVLVTRKDGKELKKQDVNVADLSGCCRLVLWEGDVNKLDKGKNYRLVDVNVKTYAEMKHLLFGPHSSMLSVCNEESSSDSRYVEGEISSVISTNEYASCKFCNCKVLSEDEIVGQCSKCNAVFKMSKCSVTITAKVIITDEKGKDHPVTIFEPILSKVVEGVNGDSLATKLVLAPAFVYKINKRDVVFSVTQFES